MSLISRTKADAKRARLAFDHELDQADCGIALLKEVNPRAAKAAADYNAAMALLREHDPAFPKDKFIPL